MQSVFELAQQAGLSKVGIVCTKSDVRSSWNLLILPDCYSSCLLIATPQDIRAEEAMKDWRGRLANRVQQLSDAVSFTRKMTEDINLQLAEIDECGTMELTDEDQRVFNELQKEQRQT